MAYNSEFKSEEDFKQQNGYDIDGVWYPRVTRIVDIKAKPALYRFYGDVGFANGQLISQKSAEEGTAVHEAVERLLIGEKAGDVPLSIAPSIYAFIEFFKNNPIAVQREHVERRIVNTEHRFAGTIDTIAKIDGRLGVLDIKTSEAVYRDYGIQTSAYMDTLVREFPTLETRWILRIDQNQTCKECNATMRTKGGRVKVKKNGNCGRSPAGERHDSARSRITCPAIHSWNEPKGMIELVELSGWKDDFKAFLGAKALWEWEHADWLRRIGY